MVVDTVEGAVEQVVGTADAAAELVVGIAVAVAEQVVGIAVVAAAGIEVVVGLVDCCFHKVVVVDIHQPHSELVHGSGRILEGEARIRLVFVQGLYQGVPLSSSSFLTILFVLPREVEDDSKKKVLRLLIISLRFYKGKKEIEEAAKFENKI